MAQTPSPSPSPSPSVFTTFFRWLRLKNYQYEVTFSLYMLTSTEKIIFNSLLILLVSLFLIAAYVYLPNHVVTICSHVWYYWAGDPYSEPFDAALHAAVNYTTDAPIASATESPTDIVSMATATARKVAEL